MGAQKKRKKTANSQNIDTIKQILLQSILYKQRRKAQRQVICNMKRIGKAFEGHLQKYIFFKAIRRNTVVGKRTMYTDQLNKKRTNTFRCAVSPPDSIYGLYIYIFVKKKGNKDVNL